jgi:hypothetical protein
LGKAPIPSEYRGSITLDIWSLREALLVFLRFVECFSK